MRLFILLLGHTDNIVRLTKSKEADTHVESLFYLLFACLLGLHLKATFGRLMFFPVSSVAWFTVTGKGCTVSPDTHTHTHMV